MNPVTSIDPAVFGATASHRWHQCGHSSSPLPLRHMGQTNAHPRLLSSS